MPSGHGPVDYADSTITPETGFRVSLIQAVLIMAAIFLAAMAYAYLVWGQQATGKDVVEIKTKQSELSTTTSAAVVMQEEKREKLAKDFLASNEKIADSIGKLTTLISVQQERQKQTDEKLERVLSQIGTALSTGPRSR